MPEETVTIPLEHYRKLLSVDRKMDYLIGGGVDNWDWYGESLEEYEPVTIDEARTEAAKHAG